MAAFFENVLAASFHGSIVILAVLLLRLLLRKAPRKYICWLWLLAGVRLLMPFEIQSELSLQPENLPQIITRVPPGLAVLLWAAVALGFLAYSLFSYLALRRKVREAVKISGGWEAAGIETAFILGFVRPKIYIPMGMDDTARRHILAHERTHLDKGDHWIKMIGFLALGLHWFNPLVWVAYILLCRDIETACDERVVQFMELNERKEYSAALLDCSTSRIRYAASPVAFGEVGVKGRILSVLNYHKPSFLMGALSMAAVTFVTLCLVTSPTEPPAIQAAAPTEAAAVEEITPPPDEPVSPWGLSLIAEATSPTTLTLYSGVNVDGIPWDGVAIVKDQGYWLERWDGKAWTELLPLVEEPRYEGSYGMEYSVDNLAGYYHQEDLDWTLLYGPLTGEYYRVGIRLERQGQTMPHYAQFRIWTNQLAQVEAQVVERCENALSLLLGKDSWSVTLYRTNSFGEDLPVRRVYKSNTQGRIDSFVGDYCYNTYYCDLSERRMTDWAEDFRLDENKRISFLEEECVITDKAVCLVATWENTDGISFREVIAYSFGPDGSLTGARRSVTGSDGSNRRTAMEVGNAYWMDTISPEEYPEDAQEASADSPWGLFFRVDDDYLSPTGGEVWFSAGERVGVIPYTTDGAYWLERKSEGKWQALECVGTPRWSDREYRLRAQTTVNQVDWSYYYGELEPGLYRMGKRFYDAEESIIQYAEFYIYPQGNVLGEGGEEAIARVNAALERVQVGNYHIVETTSGGFHAPEATSTVYWKYGDDCIVDYYDYGNYRHSGLNSDPTDTVFYHQWLWVASWNEPRVQVYFAPGASLISQEQITFATAFTGNDRLWDLLWYSVFFDEQGDITRIEYYSPGYVYGEDDRKTTFYFMDTSDEETAAWVEEIRTQQS